MASHIEAIDDGAAALHPSLRERLGALTGAVFGNTLEWFDFAVYGILASYISKAFFPQDDPGAALLTTFAVFGVGFVLRPLGGLIIGRIGDARGRKPAFLLTIVTMACGTLMIGLMPPHGAIGILAPLLLVVARLLQGFSAGGEFGVATSYLAEWAPSGKRGYWTSFLAVTVALGSFLANGISALLISLLPPDRMEAWGWRVPFVLGALLGFVALWIRAGIAETPAYRISHPASAARSRPPSRVRVKRVLLAMGFTTHWTVCYYMFLLYMPTFTRVQAHLSPAQSVWSNTIGLLAVVALVPVVGRLSDRYGRKPFLLASCVSIIVLTAPALWLIAHYQSFAMIVAIQIVLGAAIALYSGPGPAMTAELFSTAGRSQWAAFSYAMAVAIFGGFAPFIADWLIRTTGSQLSPALYVIAAASISILSILQIPETAHTPLNEL